MRRLHPDHRGGGHAAAYLLISIRMTLEKTVPLSLTGMLKGNLFVEFSIRFPATLTAQQKDSLKEILK